MIQAMIFDLDDTLYAYEPLDKKARDKVEKYTCEILGISVEQYREVYAFGRQETKKKLSEVGAGHNRLLYCQKTLEYLGIPPMPLSLRMYEQYWDTFIQEMKVFSGVKELFNLLQANHIPIVICTDLTAHIQHRKIEALGIAQYIKYLVSSEEAGREKPGKEIFALCLEKLKLPPQHIWYVGDSFHKDVEGAADMGMQAIWFHSERSQSDEKAGGDTQKNSYQEVRDYAELTKLVMKELERK